MNHKNVLIKAFTLLLISLFYTNIYSQVGSGFDMEKVNNAIVELKKADSSIEAFFDDSYGYAVFPSIGKGAIGIGGAVGKGLVFKNDKLEGGTKMHQLTIGFQFGGKSYMEVIFFKNARAFKNFVDGKFQFAAQASAVALKSGAAANAKYAKGVAVFTMANGGLMYEASVGGQKFSFVPKAELQK